MEKAKSVAEIPDTYLICRDLGHSWNFLNDSVLWGADKRPQIVTRTLKCMRCPTQRKDSYHIPSLAKVVNSTRYTYPDQYLIGDDVTKGVRFDRAHARAEHYNRMGFSDGTRPTLRTAG